MCTASKTMLGKLLTPYDHSTSSTLTNVSYHGILPAGNTKPVAPNVCVRYRPPIGCGGRVISCSIWRALRAIPVIGSSRREKVMSSSMIG